MDVDRRRLEATRAGDHHLGRERAAYDDTGAALRQTDAKLTIFDRGADIGALEHTTQPRCPHGQLKLATARVQVMDRYRELGHRYGLGRRHRDESFGAANMMRTGLSRKTPLLVTKGPGAASLSCTKQSIRRFAQGPRCRPR